jgi:hypothetical protein
MNNSQNISYEEKQTMFDTLNDILLEKESDLQLIMFANNEDYFMEKKDKRYASIINEINECGQDLESFCKRYSFENKGNIRTNINEDMFRRVGLSPMAMSTLRGEDNSINAKEVTWVPYKEMVNKPTVKFESSKSKFEADKIEFQNNKDWSIEKIKILLNENDFMVCECIAMIYKNNQTFDEQMTGRTRDLNGIGFNGVDSSFMSSLANFYIEKGFLSSKQIISGRKTLKKYIKQIINLFR